MSRFSKTALIAGAIALCASPAFAHPGHEFGHTALQGFLHPLGGIDHVIAMIAVGFLALCRGGRAIWTVPLAFVLMMAVGAVLGATGLGLPGVEQGIAASVLVLGMLIVVATRPPYWWAHSRSFTAQHTDWKVPLRASCRAPIS